MSLSTDPSCRDFKTNYIAQSMHTKTKKWHSPSAMIMFVPEKDMQYLFLLPVSVDCRIKTAIRCN